MIRNTFRRGETGTLVSRQGFDLKKVDNGSGVTGWVVTSKAMGVTWVPDRLDFRSAAKFFERITRGRGAVRLWPAPKGYTMQQGIWD